MDAIELTWPGGTHEFCLRLGELRTLQDRCDAGPEEILNRFRLGNWRVNDLIEPLRLGLIGAGLAKEEARELVVPLLDQYPLADFKMAAHAVLAHALLGPMDDNEDQDDASGEAVAREEDETGAGSSLASTETAL